MGVESVSVAEMLSHANTIGLQSLTFSVAGALSHADTLGLMTG